ncbi:MAG: hypothetical protein AB7F74_11220 [Parvibaculaceae bacterium]
MHHHLSRRRFLQGTAGGFAAAAGMSAPWRAQQAFAAGLADQELRTVRLSVTAQERILNELPSRRPWLSRTGSW